ncbi:hypothetical protein CGRA01v4_12895 [Colletotrichum graminicola]|nr:hypothetical protein CGRA01v4_12895 [Colletotrichum graminicola]
MVRDLQSSLQRTPQQNLQSRTRRKVRLAWEELRKGDLEKLEMSFPRRAKPWLQDLRDSDIDLLQYGRAEALKIKFTALDVKGVFDADALATSRRHVRSLLRMRKSRMQMVDNEHPGSDPYWLPAN